jgi:hypothetical protein
MLETDRIMAFFPVGGKLVALEQDDRIKPVVMMHARVSRSILPVSREGASAQACPNVFPS